MNGTYKGTHHVGKTIIFKYNATSKIVTIKCDETNGKIDLTSNALKEKCYFFITLYHP